jgi:hypothetical protein
MTSDIVEIFWVFIRYSNQTIAKTSFKHEVALADMTILIILSFDGLPMILPFLSMMF